MVTNELNPKNTNKKAITKIELNKLVQKITLLGDGHEEKGHGYLEIPPFVLDHTNNVFQFKDKIHFLYNSDKGEWILDDENIEVV